MKRTVRQLALSIALVLMFVSLAACGTTTTTTTTGTTSATMAATTTTAGEVNWITAADISAMPETTIRYWFYESPELTELGAKQIEAFQAKFPNIKVKGSTAPDSTDNEMLMPYVTSRTNSNLHQSINNEDLWYIDHDLLYPVSNFPDFAEFYAKFNPNLNYTWTDGKTYSLSWYNTPMLMYYNKKMLENVGWDTSKAPETYAEFFDLAKKISDPAKKQWMMAPAIGEEWWQWEFCVQPFYIAACASSQVVNSDGKTVMFDNENGVKALGFFETMFKNDWALKENADVDPFLSGQVAAVCEGGWEIRTIADNAPEGFEYIIGQIPVPDGNTRGAADTFSFVRNLCIIDELGVAEGEERDRIRRASWEFMKFLLSEEQMAAHFKASGDLPCFKDLENNSVIKPVLDEYGDKIKQVIALNKNGVTGDMNSLYECSIMDTMQQAYLQVAYGNMTSAEALAKAVVDANQIIVNGGTK